MTDFRL